MKLVPNLCTFVLLPRRYHESFVISNFASVSLRLREYSSMCMVRTAYPMTTSVFVPVFSPMPVIMRSLAGCCLCRCIQIPAPGIRRGIVICFHSVHAEIMRALTNSVSRQLVVFPSPARPPGDLAS